VSQKVLIQQLRELEEHGLVHREVFRQVPPRVDYSATTLGLSLEPVLRALCEWGQRHATELNELDRLVACKVSSSSPRMPGSAARQGNVPSFDSRVRKESLPAC
jgi:hypothetical protein